MKKFLRAGVILLFFVLTLVQPNEACRVLIKGKEEAWANDKPSILVLQTLQKGTVPSPGNPIGYTPGSPRPAGDTANTRAIKGKEEAWANDKTSVLVLQTLGKGPVPPPGNPKGHTPSTPKPPADTTNTRAFVGQAMAPLRVVNPAAFLSHGVTADLQTMGKGLVPPPGNPKGHTPGTPNPLVDTTNTRAFSGRAMAPLRVVNPVTFLSHGVTADRT